MSAVYRFVTNARKVAERCILKISEWEKYLIEESNFVLLINYQTKPLPQCWRMSNTGMRTSTRLFGVEDFRRPVRSCY